MIQRTACQLANAAIPRALLPRAAARERFRCHRPKVAEQAVERALRHFRFTTKQMRIIAHQSEADSDATVSTLNLPLVLLFITLSRDRVPLLAKSSPALTHCATTVQRRSRSS